MSRFSKASALHIIQFRNGQSTVGGPKWTKTNIFRPKWTVLVHFGLANAKIRFGTRSF